MSILAIYTAGFPYGNSETFLQAEILELSQYFNKIYIIPSFGRGAKRGVPDNVVVLTPLREKRWSNIRVYLKGLICFRELYNHEDFTFNVPKISFFKRVKYYGYAILTKNKIKEHLPSDASLHYSYWLDFNAFSLSVLKKEGIIESCICRAHGFDLYNERGEKSLSFIRPATLKNIDKVFLISEHGRDYLMKQFPEFAGKYLIARLGTSDPGFLNPIPEITDFTILSCSVINANKRISLIEESLICFNNKYPSINVKWYHLGGGPGINIFRERTAVVFKDSSIQCYFPGQMTSSEIFEVYKTIPVSLFINVSESEGLPVSIMEAQSFGVPVIATGVGGTPEIVDIENGFLLEANPAPMEIAELLYNIYRNPEGWKDKRSRSRESWESKFRAELNYKEFGVAIKSLIAESQMESINN